MNDITVPEVCRYYVDDPIFHLPSFWANFIVFGVLFLFILFFVFMILMMNANKKMDDRRSIVLDELYRQQTGSTISNDFKNFTKKKYRL